MIAAEFETFARQEDATFRRTIGQARESTRATLLFQITPRRLSLPPVSLGRAGHFGERIADRPGGVQTSWRLDLFSRAVTIECGDARGSRPAKPPSPTAFPCPGCAKRGVAALLLGWRPTERAQEPGREQEETEHDVGLWQ